MKIKFTNAVIVTGNENFDIVYGELVTNGKEIEYVGPKYTNKCDKVIDAKGGVLMAGFVNAHCHSAMTIFKGLGEDCLFEDWWVKHMKPLENQFKDGEYYKACMLAFAEMIKNGVTTVVDLYMHPNETAKALKDAGLRGLVGVGAIRNDMPADEKEIEEQMESVKKENPDCGFVVYGHSTYSCDEAQFAELLKVCKKHNLPFTTHASETLYEVGECVKQNEKTPIELLESYGMFDIKCVLAHGVHVEKEEMEILKNYDVSIASNPSSNLKLGSGIAPIYSYLKNGINVCLGTDGSASNNAFDMFREMYLLSTLQKGVMHNAMAVSATDAIKSATINGAKAFGLNKIGVLQKGYFADIILLDGINLKPLNNVCANIVYSANPSNVKLTMVNGEILYENGKFTNLNIEKIVSDAQNIINSISK